MLSLLQVSWALKISTLMRNIPICLNWSNYLWAQTCLWDHLKRCFYNWRNYITNKRNLFYVWYNTSENHNNAAHVKTGQIWFEITYLESMKWFVDLIWFLKYRTSVWKCILILIETIASEKIPSPSPNLFSRELRELRSFL